MKRQCLEVPADEFLAVLFSTFLITAGQKQLLQQEFEQLLNIFFASESSMSKADIKKLRESGVFGPLSFWVTEIKNLEEEGPQPGMKLGVLIRGNLRTDRTTVFESLCEKVSELFGDKYGVLMIEDPEAFDAEGAPLTPPPPSSSGRANGSSSGSSNAGAAAAEAPEPRVAFQIVPSSALVPPTTTGWQIAVAGVLVLLLLLACGQLSLVANITKLPKVRCWVVSCNLLLNFMVCHSKSATGPAPPAVAKNSKVEHNTGNGVIGLWMGRCIGL